MTSVTDLPQQPDKPQQLPPPMKKKSNLVWKVIFILLLIVNIMFAFGVEKAFSHSEGANLGALGVILLALPLVIIDFITIFFYMRTAHPKGIIVKVISYIVFIAVSFVLAYVAWAVLLIWLMGHDDSRFFSFIANPTHSMVIVLLITFFIVVLLRPKLRK